MERNPVHLQGYGLHGQTHYDVDAVMRVESLKLDVVANKSDENEEALRRVRSTVALGRRG